MAEPTERDATRSINLAMAAVGAAAGAASGALAWFAVEYYAGYQLPFVALLIGIAAGFGASTLGKGTGFRVAVIAMALGLLGIIGGSYGSYAAYKRAKITDRREKIDKLPEAQRAEATAKLDETADSYTYFEHVKSDTRSCVWIAVFGVIGLAYGYRIGLGGDGDGDTGTDAVA